MNRLLPLLFCLLTSPALAAPDGDAPPTHRPARQVEQVTVTLLEVVDGQSRRQRFEVALEGSVPSRLDAADEDGRVELMIRKVRESDARTVLEVELDHHRREGDHAIETHHEVARSIPRGRRTVLSDIRRDGWRLELAATLH